MAIIKLTDQKWNRISPFLPRITNKGRPPKWPLRLIFEAILIILQEDCRWSCMKKIKGFPLPSTIHDWFRKWGEDGSLEAALETIIPAQRNSLLWMDPLPKAPAAKMTWEKQNVEKEAKS